MMTRILAVAMLASMVLETPRASQPPTPTKPEREQQEQNHADVEPQEGQLNGQASVPTIQASPTVADQPAPQAQTRQENAYSSLDWGVFIFTGLLVVFTCALARVGYLQWRTHEATLAANKLIERAYVSASHVPPGIEGLREDAPAGIVYGLSRTRRWSVRIRVTNSGNTPADIVGVVVTPVDAAALPNVAPKKTPISAGTTVACLMPNDHFDHWELRDPVPDATFDAIEQGTLRLFIIATVEYLDRFGRGHRSGYARQYIHTPLPGTTNNLVFVDASGYDYEVDVDVRGN